MQKKLADKGLVVITVSVDDVADKAMVAEANEFLRKEGRSPFRHLLLDEPREVWTKKLDFSFPPCYYIFDRHGKWVRFRGSDYEKGVPYAQMDKAVQQMLDEK
jgi:hypothetical protein